jgi:hypothetical protein
MKLVKVVVDAEKVVFMTNKSTWLTRRKDMGAQSMK